MPTVMHIFNQPIPSDVDGKVLKKAFKENSTFYKRNILHKEEEHKNNGEKNRIKERIEQLKQYGKI